MGRPRFLCGLFTGYIVQTSDVSQLVTGTVMSMVQYLCFTFILYLLQSKQMVNYSVPVTSLLIFLRLKLSMSDICFASATFIS
jgi:hypothetical protein